MKEGYYLVKKGGTVVAYVRLTPRSLYLTPAKISGAELNTVHDALLNGKVPDGFTVTENTKVGQPVKTREKAEWGEMAAVY